MGDNKLAPMKIVIVGTSRNASFCFQPTQPTTNQGGLQKEDSAGGQEFSWEKGFNVSLHLKTATKCIELDPIETQISNVLAEGLIISLFRPKNSNFFDHLCSQKIEAGYMTWQ